MWSWNRSRRQGRPSVFSFNQPWIPWDKNNKCTTLSQPARKSIPDIHHFGPVRLFNYCNEFPTWLQSPATGLLFWIRTKIRSHSPLFLLLISWLFSTTITDDTVVSEMYKMITCMEYSQTAGPIHSSMGMSLCLMLELVSMDVTVSVTQTCNLLWATHVWLQKYSNLHILLVSLSSCPALHKCVIIHGEGLIGCSKRIGEHPFTIPISDYLDYLFILRCILSFPYAYLLTSSLYFIQECEMFKHSF